MCERCDGITRRQIVKAAGLGLAGIVAAGLTGCEEPPAVTHLPEVYQDHLTQETGEGTTPVAPLRIDPKKIVVPAPRPPERTQYGDIMARAAWTPSRLELSLGSPIDGVHRITIHHSGDGKPFITESAQETARHLQIVREAHLQRGMIDIGYHFAVDRAGRVWQLRWLKYEGQHVRIGKNGVRWNEHNVGIVMLGDFNLQSPTVVQRDRLFSLVKLVQGEYTSPGRTGAVAISMHGELVQTDCPGRRLEPLIAEGRRRGLL